MKISNQKGWLLVDALIASVLLSIAIVGIIKVFSYTTTTASYNEHYNEALMIAKTEIENFRLSDNRSNDMPLFTPNSTTNNALVTTVASPNKPNFNYTVTKKILTATEVTDSAITTSTLNTIRVTVSWTDISNHIRSVQLEGYCYE
ncbi:MAG: hypothetical protein KBI38_07090 [Negativicutes bacterium]|nr:hypothetical protein [Negativicutes bacterium]MBP9537740.1 hypothetical protein [Negativicutes bacterium]MBP9949907.1 hypothetical protein [Negativicutes bacterium]